MRILVYGDVGGSGGYVRYCKGLFGSDSIPEGHEVYFLCSPQLYKKLEPLDVGVKVITHPWPSSPSRLKRYLWHLWVYPRLVRQIRPDVEFYPVGQVRVLGRKAKTVATCHNLLLFDRKEVDRFGDQATIRELLKYRSRQARSFLRASGVIFLSRHSQTKVLEEIPEIKLSTVIPHGIEPRFILPKNRSYSLGNPITLLYVSSILPYKNHAVVVRAVKNLRETTGRDIRLRLVGGADRSTLKNLEGDIVSEGASEFVILTGEKNDQELLLEYRNADIFVFASSCECFPNTLLEAMSAALPIVCSNRAGLPEIPGNTALFFDPHDADELAKALGTMLGNQEQRRSLGLAAYRRAGEFLWADSSKCTFDFIRRLGGR